MGNSVHDSVLHDLALEKQPLFDIDFSIPQVAHMVILEKALYQIPNASGLAKKG